MSETLRSLRRPQFYIEPSYGTDGAATRAWCNLENDGFELNPEQNFEESGEAGGAFLTRADLITEMSKGSLKLHGGYDDIGYIFNSIFGAATHTNLSAGVEQNTWLDAYYKEIVPQSYTVEGVDAMNNRSYKANGVVIPGLKIESGAGKAVKLSAPLMGGPIIDPATPSSGQNGSQLISVLGTPSSGNFIMQDTETGNVTVAFGIGGSASALQALLRTLAGNWATCTVTGSSGGPWTATSPTGKLLPLLTPIYTDAAGVSTLVGGTNPSVTVAYVVQGGMKMNVLDKMQPDDLRIAYAGSLADLINAPLVANDHFETTLDFGERFSLLYRQNVAGVKPNLVKQKKAADIKDTGTLLMAYDSSVASLIAASKSRANLFTYLRLAWTGRQIGNTGVNRSLILDVACRPQWKAIKDSAGNIDSVDIDLHVMYDKATGFRSRAILTNGVADYTAN